MNESEFHHEFLKFMMKFILTISCHFLVLQSVSSLNLDDIKVFTLMALPFEKNTSEYHLVIINRFHPRFYYENKTEGDTFLLDSHIFEL